MANSKKPTEAVKPARMSRSGIGWPGIPGRQAANMKTSSRGSVGDGVMNIADTFEKNARQRPDHPAVEDGDKVVTYAELQGLAATMATNLLNVGVQPGDSVGLIRYRSNRIATSYQNDAQANARTFREGWFYPLDLVAYCGKQIAPYKVPGSFSFLPEMPKNSMGKILKSRLKEMLKQELAKQS